MNIKSALVLFISSVIACSPAFAANFQMKAALTGVIQTVEGKQSVFVQTSADGKFEIQAGAVLIIEEAIVIEDRLDVDGPLVLKIGSAELQYTNVFGAPVYRLKLAGESAELKSVVYLGD